MDGFDVLIITRINIGEQNMINIFLDIIYCNMGNLIYLVLPLCVLITPTAEALY